MLFTNTLDFQTMTINEHMHLTILPECPRQNDRTGNVAIERGIDVANYGSFHSELARHWH